MLQSRTLALRIGETHSCLRRQHKNYALRQRTHYHTTGHRAVFIRFSDSAIQLLQMKDILQRVHCRLLRVSEMIVLRKGVVH
jgi:hypothetical protein